MSDPAKPIRVVEETPDTVTLHRSDYEALIDELEDAEDRIALLEHRLATPEMLTADEADRLIAGENPVRFWRDKRGYTVRSLAASAGMSPSLVSEIENGTKEGSIDTLRKLALALKVDVDTLLP
jgi:predicted transcriptional regulator